MLVLRCLVLLAIVSTIYAQSLPERQPERLPKRVLTRSQQVSRRNFPGPSFRQQGRRAEPQLAADILDSAVHPSPRDRVNGAIYDALQLVLVALDKIDNDNTIFPNYFSRRDRVKVKAVFQAIAGPCNTGNVMLSQLTIRTTDEKKLCSGGDTFAYLYPNDADQPFLTICPLFFKKKHFTMVKGARDPENDPDHYVRCQEIQANGHVSYVMETMGATLLHEYTHFDKLIKPVYSKSILDQSLDDGTQAYGSFYVYNNLNKNIKARVNADSYTYYALELFWTEVCQTNFLPPRENIDDIDPDCGGTPCTDRSVSSSGGSSSDGSSLSPPPSSDDLGSVPPAARLMLG
ncbi:MAG: hypothetical protein Q9169_006955 [Polycauliona sp. 2 TL-2023]